MKKNGINSRVKYFGRETDAKQLLDLYSAFWSQEVNMVILVTSGINLFCSYASSPYHSASEDLQSNYAAQFTVLLCLSLPFFPSIILCC